ncbi:MAG: hypothetical protein ACYC0X_18330 [Pirellulaceae bacterium]
MRKHGHPPGSMVGVAIAIILLTVVVSWSRFEGSVAAVSAAGPVSRPRSTEEDRAVGSQGVSPAPGRQSDREHDPSERLPENVALRRTAPSMPPGADRVFRDAASAAPLHLPSLNPLPGHEPPKGAESASSQAGELSAEIPGPALARRAIEHAPDIMTCWPLPVVTLSSLKELSERQVATAWIEQVETLLRQLHEVPSLADPQAGRILDQLDPLVTAASTIASEQANFDDRTQLLRNAFSLERRFAVWRSVHQLAGTPVQPVAALGASGFVAATMNQQVMAVEAQISRLDNADAWRTFLLLDEVRQLEAQQWTACATQRSRLAREILTRLDGADGTVAQKQFFAAPVWQNFTIELRKWVIEPVDYESLLDDLERLEETGLEGPSEAIAEYYQMLRWSSSPPVAKLAEHLNTYYRNANIRVAISADLVNRLLPHPPTMNEDVDDTLLGGRVFGRSRVSTRLRLVLFPDRQQWKMGLEAEGQVDSRTETKRGPAVFHNAARGQYLARKVLMVDNRGLRTQEAEAAAISDADLTHMETDLDGIPLVNLLVRAIARQQYDSNVNAAKWETEGLLATRAQSRLDEEVEKQLRESTDKFRTQILEPLQALGLRPEAVDMETTQQRLIARYRLAGYQQVGAFTPRPQAPSDSLLSVQIHETALNNVMASLQLGGKDTDLPSLGREIARHFRRDNYQVPDDVPTDVMIRLADRDPIRFTCHDDRIELTLRIAKLDAGAPNVWRDIEVRALYLPEVEGLHVRLVRDGYIRLKGRRLAMRDQVALRGIFSKVLAQHPAIDLLGNLVRDRRLRDLRVSQFVLRDGWIGLSLATGQPVKAHLADAIDDSRRG